MTSKGPPSTTSPDAGDATIDWDELLAAGRPGARHSHSPVRERLTFRRTPGAERAGRADDRGASGELTCTHGSEALIHEIEALPTSQSGVGRHRCAVCAYVRGYEAGVLAALQTSTVTSTVVQEMAGRVVTRTIPGVSDASDSVPAIGGAELGAWCEALHVDPENWLGRTLGPAAAADCDLFPAQALAKAFDPSGTKAVPTSALERALQRAGFPSFVLRGRLFARRGVRVFVLRNPEYWPSAEVSEVLEHCRHFPTVFAFL
jgi:hypothetical protein